MIAMAAGVPPLREYKVIIALGDAGPLHAATLHLPPDAPPPTRAEYADALRAVARNLAAAPEGTQVPAAGILVQRT